MLQSSPKTDSKGKHASRLVDYYGEPLPQPLTWKKKWYMISAKTKIVVVSLAAVVATTATFLANLEKIQDYFRPDPVQPLVPAITVKLSNSSM